MSTYTYTGSLEIIECANCHQDFGVTPHFKRDRRADRREFYCPSGHRQWYPPPKVTTEDKLRAANAKLTATEDQLRAATEEAERIRVALLRDRQRFANGVCPCCNRSFTNVRRHMETKHPDYDPSELRGPMRFGCSCGRHFDTLRGLRVHQGHNRHRDWYRPGASRWLAHLTEVPA